MSNEPRLDEQVISQVAKSQLTNQLDGADAIDVTVHTDLLKAAQGKADSVSVEGKGLVVQDEIRVQELELHTDGVAIDPLSVLLGQLKLTQPINTAMRVLLTEVDINRTVNSDFVRKRLKPIELKVAGDIVPVELKLPMEMQLPSVNTIAIQGNACLHEASGPRQVSFSVVMHPRTRDQPVMLEEFHCDRGKGLSLEFTIALMQKIQEFVDAPYVEIEGIAVRIKQLDVRAGEMVVVLEAHVNQIPSL